MQLNIKNNNNNKKGRRSKRHFSKENIRMADSCMMVHIIIMIIREMQIKTTMRYHLTPVRMAIIKSLQTNPGEGMEKRECSCTVGGNVN